MSHCMYTLFTDRSVSMAKKGVSYFLFFTQFLFFWAVIGALSGVFMKLVRVFLHLIWEVLPDALFHSGPNRYFYILVPIFGGIIVGLCQVFLGDNPKQIKELIKGYRKTGRFNAKTLPQGFITTVASLAFGAGLGPEIELVDMTGSLGTLASDFSKKMALSSGILNIKSINDPFPKKFKKILIVIASLIFLPFFVGTMLALNLTAGIMASSPQYQFDFTHILYMLPASAIGFLGGKLFRYSDDKLGDLLGKAKNRPFLKALSGGIFMGVVARFLPLILFSGQFEFRYLYEGMNEQGAYIVMLTGVLKLFIAAYLLNTGWKGGSLMPLTFGGAALGLGLNMLIPGATPIVGVLAGATGTLLAYTGNALGAFILVQLLFEPNVAIITGITAIIGWVPMKLYKISLKRKMPQITQTEQDS